jgi:hypothetical protein
MHEQFRFSYREAKVLAPRAKCEIRLWQRAEPRSTKGNQCAWSWEVVFQPCTAKPLAEGVKIDFYQLCNQSYNATVAGMSSTISHPRRERLEGEALDCIQLGIQNPDPRMFREELTKPGNGWQSHRSWLFGRIFVSFSFPIGATADS